MPTTSGPGWAPRCGWCARRVPSPGRPQPLDARQLDAHVGLDLVLGHDRAAVRAHDLAGIWKLRSFSSMMRDVARDDRRCRRWSAALHGRGCRPWAGPTPGADGGRNPHPHRACRAARRRWWHRDRLDDGLEARIGGATGPDRLAQRRGAGGRGRQRQLDLGRARLDAASAWPVAPPRPGHRGDRTGLVILRRRGSRLGRR